MHTTSDFLGENKSFITLTQLFNNYITYELSKLSDKQVKMNKFYDYVNEEYSIKKLDFEIILTNNTDLKSIYFNESRWENLEFKIFNSNGIEIVINEKHKTADFAINDCNDINLIFILESDKDGFTNQNNFSFKECKFKMIEIRAPLEDKYKFSFNYKLDFLNCEIEKMDRIENKEFHNSLTFDNTTFKEFLNLNKKIFNADVKFINCTFLKDISFQETKFNDNVKFINCVFMNNMVFKRATFEKGVEFQNCVFNNKVDFSNATFKDNAYFNDSKFKGVFMLYRAQFYKVADFFNLEFNDIYNFSSCAFKEPEFVSFIGFKTNINIETLENYIEKTDKKERANEEHKSMIVKRTEITWAENLKNSFAVIKHNFLQRDNLIEANKHKVLEFYAEELRLKYECKIKERCWLRSLIAFPKNTINFIQLLFYRHTSNHHSDLLKSFHTILLLIALFAIFNYLIVSAFNCCLDVFAFDMQTYSAIINNFIATNKSYLILINLLIIFVFLLSFLGFLYLKNKINKTIVSLSYVCTFLLLAISPKSIISITNLFSGNQHILDPLSALSGIYTILFILLIYSLQKTSRRNSIM